MQTSDLVGVIMAGGSGTRFWPLSTPDRPKQFLTLFGDRSLLQLTFDRLTAPGGIRPDRVIVLTSTEFTGLVREQLPELPPGNVVGEPLRRDTAAAVTLAAWMVRERFGDVPMLVAPSDHLVEPVDLFLTTVASALLGLAREPQAIYTFGIEPRYPATGYGYLELGAPMGGWEGVVHHELVSFKEKPDLETAHRFLRDGHFLWNSGIFLWKAGTILEAIGRHLPAHRAAFERLRLQPDGLPATTELQAALEPLARISIDFGVMEKESHLRAVRAGFEWSDVGGWLEVENAHQPDERRNRARGQVRLMDAEGNFVFSEDPDEVVALLGVEDLVVVRSGKRTLVARRERLAGLKALVSQRIHPEG